MISNEGDNWLPIATCIEGGEGEILFHLDELGRKVYCTPGHPTRYAMGEAVCDTVEFENAAMLPVILKMIGTTYERPFIVYDGRGGWQGKYRTQSAAVKKAEAIRKIRKLPQSRIEARKKAYIERSRGQSSGQNVLMKEIKKAKEAKAKEAFEMAVARRKQQILEEKRRAKQYEAIKDVHGSW